jgi:hypothetical protein
MLFDGESGLLAQLVQKRSKVAAFELDRGAALTADQMVPVPMVGCGIAMAAILGMDAPNKSHARKQVQCAVHGYEPDRIAMRPGSHVDLGRASVPSILHQCPYYGPPRLGDAVTGQAQFVEYLFFTQHDPN